MTEVNKSSKIQIHWKTNPYDYSEEKKNELIAKVSRKYNIPKTAVKITPDFIMKNKDGETMSFSNELILNIQNPSFQLELFQEYLKMNGIEDYDFDFIKKIDSTINANIDYDAYDKYRQYSIKWIRWNNFLSYGEDNYFDFTTLNGLVLLNGNPANQSGKTTFAIDLLHFLFFGSSDKYKTQDKLFNDKLLEATELSVEGCVNIEGEDYVIKRTITRPQLKKRTSKSKANQKVEYYRLVGDTLEELADVEACHGESSRSTNKIIKETIGKEDDFNLIVCATNKNLDDLIEKKETERGRILARWIGLLPIEKKEELAKEEFNSNIKPFLVSNKYDAESLLLEREGLILQIENANKEIEKYVAETTKVDENIKLTEQTKTSLLLAKQNVNENVTKIDITTLNTAIENLTNKGVAKKAEISNLTNEIDSIDVGTFSEDVYEALSKRNVEYNSKLSEYRFEYKTLRNQSIDLEKSEYCPTCGKKFDNVDNSQKIKELNDRMNIIQNEAKILTSNIAEINQEMQSMKEARENFNKKSQLLLKKSAAQVQIEQMRNDLREKLSLLDEFKKNEDIINKNNEIDLNLRNIEHTLLSYRNMKESNIQYIEKMTNSIENYNKNIFEIEKLVDKINEEKEIVKNWKIYLDMIGKNGISKMVVRKSLPILNAQLSALLSDVCDFEVKINMTDKNEVVFNLINGDTVRDISGVSGFEATAAALALRFVLAKNSILPKMNSIVLDEITGRVAQDNLENIKTIIDRAKKDYQFIIIVTHNETVKEYCNTIITVTKENGVSKLNTTFLK